MLEELNRRIELGDEQAISEKKFLGTLYQDVNLMVQLHTEFQPASDAVQNAENIAEAFWLAIRTKNSNLPAAACKKGCAFCCYLHVRLTEVEVLRIFEYIKERFSEEEIQAIAKRARETADAIVLLTDEERLAAKIPCSLLGPDNTCLVYEARPLGCRGFNSLDASACESSFGEPEGEIPNIKEKVAIFQAASEGLAIGTGEQQEVELNTKLAELLEV